MQELSLKKPIIVLLPVMSSIFSDEISAYGHGGRLELICRTGLGG